MSDVWEIEADYFEQIIKIGDKYYLLREASGEAANKWTNFTSKKTIMKDGAVVGVNNPADTGPYLISLCLTHCDKDGVEEKDSKDKPVPVSISEIESWPNRIQKSLFYKIIEISNLNPEEEDEEEGKS